MLFDKSYLDKERDVYVFEVDKEKLEDVSEEAYKDGIVGVLVGELMDMFPKKEAELLEITTKINKLKYGEPNDAENTLMLKSINKFADELFMVLKKEKATSNYSKEDFEKAKQQILSEAIDNENVYEVENPKLVFVGGQMGVDKDETIKKIFESLRGNAILVDRNDYIKYHPDYENFDDDPVLWDLVDEDWACELEIFINEVLSKKKYNVVVVDSLNNFLRNQRIIDQYGTGFEITVIVDAIKPDISKVNLISKYAECMRKGLPVKNYSLEMHNVEVAALPYSIGLLAKSKEVHDVIILNSKQEVIYKKTSSKINAEKFLKRVLKKPLTIQEMESVMTTCAKRIMPNLSCSEKTYPYFNLIRELHKKNIKIAKKEKTFSKNKRRNGYRV